MSCNKLQVAIAIEQFRLLKLNVKARQDIPEFMTANILWIYVIELEID